MLDGNSLRLGTAAIIEEFQAFSQSHLLDAALESYRLCFTSIVEECKASPQSGLLEEVLEGRRQSIAPLDAIYKEMKH